MKEEGEKSVIKPFKQEKEGSGVFICKLSQRKKKGIKRSIEEISN